MGIYNDGAYAIDVTYTQCPNGSMIFAFVSQVIGFLFCFSLVGRGSQATHFTNFKQANKQKYILDWAAWSVDNLFKNAREFHEFLLPLSNASLEFTRREFTRKFECTNFIDIKIKCHYLHSICMTRFIFRFILLNFQRDFGHVCDLVKSRKSKNFVVKIEWNWNGVGTAWHELPFFCKTPNGTTMDQIFLF